MKPVKLLEGQDKEKTLTYDLQFMPSGTTLDSKVRCKKCGKEFVFKDSTALELFDIVGSYEIVKCKYYPECDGLRQDFEVIYDWFIKKIESFNVIIWRY